MDSKDESEYLEHYGVLGMHWGIRRYQPYPKGHKGDGRYLGEAKRRLAQTGRVVSRTATKAGRAAVTKAKAARQAYKDAAPEREARREARAAARFERRVSNGKEKAYRHPERLSDEELAARIERLKQEKQFKELSDEVIHPGKKRIEQYQDRIVNKVIDKTMDEVINRAFKSFDEAVKKPSEADKLKKQADIAKSRADIAKAEADVQNQKNRMERLKDGSYEKGKKEKDYVLDKDGSSKESSGNQNEGQSSKTQTTTPSTSPTSPKGTGIRGMKWGVRESSSETQSSSKSDKTVSSISTSSSSPAVKRVLPASASVKLSGHEFKTGASKGSEYVKVYRNNGDGTATGKFPDARYKVGYRTETISTKR